MGTDQRFKQINDGPMSLIHVEGSPQLQAALDKWKSCSREEVNKETHLSNLRSGKRGLQINKLLNFNQKQGESNEQIYREGKPLGLIEVNQAKTWSQVHWTKKPSGKGSFCIDFLNLNNVTNWFGMTSTKP